MGIERTEGEVAAADLIVWVVDGSQPLDDDLRALGGTVSFLGRLDEPRKGLPVLLEVNTKVDFSDGSSVSNPSGVTLSSSDPSKLGLVSGNEFVTKAPSGGTNPVVTATIGTFSDTQAVTVLASSVVLTNMEFTPTSPASPSAGCSRSARAAASRWCRCTRSATSPNRWRCSNSTPSW